MVGMSKSRKFIFQIGQIMFILILLYQIRVLNKKRLQRKIGELDEKDFLRVKQKLEKLLEFRQ